MMSEERAVYISGNGTKEKRKRSPNVFLSEEQATVLNELAEQVLSVPTEPSQSICIEEVSSTPTEPLQKVSFYVTATQEEKLEDLVYEYRKQRTRRINRNDIIRYLIDQLSIDDLANL